MDLAVGVDEDVDFAADAEVGEVDAGFDGEAGAGQNLAFFVCLQIVHVGSIAVRFLADGVAGAMAEGSAVASPFDDIAGRSIDLPAVQHFAGGEGGADALDGGITGASHDLKDRLVLLGNLSADEAGPCQIAVDGTRFVELGPQVDEDEIAFADGTVAVGAGSVVRIAAVRADADNGRMIGNQFVGGEVIENALLHFGFAHGAGVAHALGDEGEGDIVGRARVLGRFQVHGPLLVVPARFELLYQVAGRDDLDAEGADQFNRPGIDARDIGIGVARDVLHRHAVASLEQRLHARLQLLPAEIALRRPRNAIQGVRFDLMHQFARFAVGRHEIEPAPREDGVGGDVEDAAGQDVQAAKVVEQPAVEFRRSQGRLDQRKIKNS